MADFVPMGRINTGNPGAIVGEGGGPRFSEISPGLLSFNKAQTERDAQEAQRDKMQREGMEKMIKDPTNADAYAQAYGIRMTPEIGQLLQNPRQAKLAVDGASLAKNMGIANPEATKAFVSSYVQNGGNVMEASRAIENISLQTPPTPYQSRYLDEYGRRTDAMRSGGGARGVQKSGDLLTDIINNPQIPFDMKLLAQRGLGKEPNLMPSEWQKLSEGLAPYMGDRSQVPDISGGNSLPAPGAQAPLANRVQRSPVAPGISGVVPGRPQDLPQNVPWPPPPPPPIPDGLNTPLPPVPDTQLGHGKWLNMPQENAFGADTSYAIAPLANAGDSTSAYAPATTSARPSGPGAAFPQFTDLTDQVKVTDPSGVEGYYPRSKLGPHLEQKGFKYGWASEGQQ